jgi:probable F420-dependent oxidoreductase
VTVGRFFFIAPMPRLAGREAWAAELRRTEGLGFHAVSVSDHYSRGWAMDALTAMNFALAHTSRLHALPLVLNNDLRHPALVAKAAATASVLSAGRAGLGIGAGWLQEDYRALGVEYQPAPVRIARLAEALRVITAFFGDQQVTVDGEYYQVAGLEALPRVEPRHRPPILVGGGGARMLDLAARYADIVGIHMRLPSGAFEAAAAAELTRARVEEKVSLVTAAAARAGRPAPELQFTCYDIDIAGSRGAAPSRSSFSAYISAHPGAFADSPASLRGDVGKCVDDLVRWNEELGISYWNLGGDIEAAAPLVARLSDQ